MSRSPSTDAVSSSESMTVHEAAHHAERRPLFWWDVSVTGVILLMAVPSAMSSIEWDHLGWHLPFLIPLGVFFAFAVNYVLLGRAALLRGSRDEPLRSRDTVFVVLLVAILVLACAWQPSFAILQVLAHPMVWSILPRYRDAVIASGMVALAVGAGSSVAYVRDGMGFGVETALLTAVLSFVFSVAMGTWISRIFARGEAYRVMVDQLREAQAEVRELSVAAGAAAERERLSRDLHDTLTQTLTGLVMLSEQASRSLDAAEVDHARDRLDRVVSAAREAVSEARALVATTQPLGDGGIEAALTRVAHRMRDDTGLVVHVDVAPLRLDREQEVVLLRAAQEGLANARKHAQASSMTVRLFEAGGVAVLEVEDDGVGIAAEHLPDRLLSRGFGLSGLRERARLSGGDASISAAQTGGTVLTVRIPLAGDTSGASDASGGGDGCDPGGPADAGDPRLGMTAPEPVPAAPSAAAEPQPGRGAVS